MWEVTLLTNPADTTLRKVTLLTTTEGGSLNVIAV
jgi:hypothetical protein